MSRENNPNAAIRHFVAIKFKKSATEEQKLAFAKGMSKLPEDAPFVYNYYQGFVVDPRYHNADMDFAICCDMPGYDAIDCYMSHPGHHAVGTQGLTHIIAKWYAFDWEVESYGRQERPDLSVVQAEIEKEKIRRMPVHPDSSMAYVPDFRGQMLSTAEEMLNQAGLKLGKVEKVMWCCWTPGRVIGCSPNMFAEVPKGTSVDIQICDDYMMDTDCPPVPDEEVHLC